MKNMNDKPTQKLFVKMNKMDFEWVVTTDFFDQVPAPDISLPVDELIIKHNIIKYTHNPFGYAIKNLKNGYESYFLNGLPVAKEEIDRLKFNADFSDHLDKILTEDSSDV